MKNNILKYGLLVIAWLVYTLPALAFPDSPGSDENDDEYQSPIDNWEFILVIIAIILGIYFVSKYRRKAMA